ncbi:hypothetical protein [Clostridium sp. UBA1652]|uniref:hypothetical protein n=1 Tax=Clostridium sp. UBA1652 TaxID=1946348 RepID=UPI00257D0A34|nr:hypothetical protein [Clostridium sp. UBA1652]
MGERQELLEKLLQKEMLEMKRKCFKYEHRPLLYNKVVVVEEDLGETTAGTWEDADKDKYNHYKFTHKITINSKVINQYVHYNKKNQVWGKWFYKWQLKSTIRHELVHGFCFENYEDFVDIKGSHYDSSPIFLSLLYFFKGITHHKCEQGFYKSKIKQDIKEIKSYKELQKYLIKLLKHYETIAEKLKMNMGSTNAYMNTFGFSTSYSNTGLYLANKDVTCIKSMDKNNKKEAYNSLYKWEIGCNIMPQDIEKLIDRKLARGIEVDKKYYIKDLTMLEIKDCKLIKTSLKK